MSIRKFNISALAFLVLFNIQAKSQIDSLQHWHGASLQSGFAYIAMTPAQKGKTIWLKPVTDAEYIGPGTKNSVSKSDELNGTWIPVQEEMGGKPLPKASFETQKLVINDSNYTFIAESVDKGIVRYTGDKMDIYGKEGVNIGKHFTAIYKYEDEKLTICYNLKGDKYPEAFETKSKPLLFMSVFQKEEEK